MASSFTKKNTPPSVGRGTSHLTRRGWGLLFSALFCVIVGYGAGLMELLYAACFLGVLPFASLILVRMRRRRLSVTRTFAPKVASAGAPVLVEIELRNLSAGASSPASWADHIPWYPGTAGPGFLPVLSGALPGYANPAAATRVRYTLRPGTRGVFPIGPLAIEYGDPFGLAAGSASLGGVQQLSVVPAVVPFGTDGPSIVSGDGSARLVQRRSSGSDDDLITREYRSGDALRRVHWRASARHGELMVRQEEQHTFPEARVLIDTREDGYGDAWADLGGEESGSGSFEWAVRMVASLGVHLHAAGFQVHLLETASAQIAPLGETNQGQGQELEFLLSLAAIRRSEEHGRHFGGITSASTSAPTSAFTRPPAAIPTSMPDIAPRAEGAAGPIFAVVAEPSDDTLRWIVAQRRTHELGVAFVVGRRATLAFETLAESGWVCVPVRETDDPALVWASISRFAGQSGGGAR
ncbi:uncharacterized protein (DUF58 family) [Glaciihabitans tibetensis]|uniref:Uncharacterized protein (DUF58 family) n=1 Tax=Glaciihabitans tibetensis TaxID=1266600 RepID=A0A2T0VI30_9MICO|nr:DUF58 domain-containing protein [Glaciihabitans tibetensis]PRY69896.1 uncharacterized protein (DUF58 family) [Glaciihabitans tibetensis]